MADLAKRSSLFALSMKDGALPSAMETTTKATAPVR